MTSPQAPGFSTQKVRLDNGLDIILIHQTGLTRAAAALRVHGGSHDAPEAYPGLAHFLEHLVFLGSARFPAGQGLIPFVQALGGEVNASTRERHTDFFFELPTSTFEGGLARLCDMISAPSLALESQAREREVLHAEFLAWSRSEGLTALLLAASLPRDHPSSRFHAGNRYSLPIRQPAFQAALHEYHRRIYGTGQKTLVLAGPQSLDELHELAQRHAGRLTSGQPHGRPPLPDLLPLRLGQVPIHSDAELNVAFILDRLPPGADQALDFLGFWLSHEHPESWFGHLRNIGLAEHLDLKVTSVGESQAILALDLRLSPLSLGKQQDVLALLFSWLTFFAGIADLHPSHDAYARARLRQLETMQPLALARHWLTCNGELPRLCPDALAALPSVLAQLQPGQLARLRGNHRKEIREGAIRPWQLPPPNRFLNDTLPPGPYSRLPMPSALRLAPEPPSANGQGALYLRWRPAGPVQGHHPLLRMLQAQLRLLISDARQAGLDVRLIREQTNWEIAFVGLTRVIPPVLQALVAQLRDMPPQLPAISEEGKFGRLLIQQMLHCLEEGGNTESDNVPGADLEWHSFWQSTVWDGLAFGLDTETLGRIEALAAIIPGKAGCPLAKIEPSAGSLHWHRFRSLDPQHAVLLFCGQPDGTAATEAAWRVLAQLIQAPFYQRIRTELQLGYGVFSSYRPIGGRPGILFGIQSPNSHAAESLQCIEQFFASFRTHLTDLEPEFLHQRAALLNERFDDPQYAANQQWQACKAGQAPGIHALRNALETLGTRDLLKALEDLREAKGGWTCIANSAPPEGHWQCIGAH